MDGISNLSKPDMSSVANASSGGSQREVHPDPRNEKRRSARGLPKVFQISYIVLFFCLLILIVSLVLYVSLDHSAQESNLINRKEYQSVFVNVTGSNGGQAYFGHIIAINSSYIVLNDVFYLQPGKSSNQFTLNKLSCALYDPVDPMVINRQQVDFWENVNNSSQIAQDINKWNSDNLQCTNSTGPTGTSGATGTSSSTTPSSSITDKSSSSTSTSTTPSDTTK
jgi:hypothetical protein